MSRLACDVGGTFTDVVARLADGRLAFAKVATTPADPVEGVLAGIALLAEQLGQEAGRLLAAAGELVHGTTIATNVLAQGRLARIGLLTTQGFRDVLELRDGTRADRYRLRVPFPAPLVPRALRLEVTERMGFDGLPRTPLDEDAARAAIAALLELAPESILVGLLHAHRNPAHELRLEALLRQAGWTGPVVLSHRVLPQEGEYVRFSTAAIEAGVAPSLQGYLARLARRLEALAGRAIRLQVMQSSGGLLPVAAAGERAARFVNSGPAGGAIAAAAIARRLGGDLVAFDVGGTTTDISVIQHGRPLERLLTRTDAHVIGLPSIDIGVLSLGGGSIARVGIDGVLQLGPDSAAAVPGPAAYGRGGDRATLTDAAIVLGLLPAGRQGALALSRDLARAALARDVATPLGLTIEAAAEAVMALAATIVAAGVRAATIGQGIDPRELALVGFGGAGGLLLGAVAREIGARLAIAPAAAAVLSAAGFLEAEMRLDTQRHVGTPLAALDAAGLAALAQGMAAELARSRQAFAAGEAPAEAAWIAECRYARQTGTVAVPIEAEAVARGDLAGLEARFEARYAALFGHVHRGEACVLDALRLVVTQPAAPAPPPSPATPAPLARRPARRVHQAGGWRDWPVLAAAEVAQGPSHAGPLLCDCGGNVVVVREDEALAPCGPGLMRLDRAAVAA